MFRLSLQETDKDFICSEQQAKERGERGGRMVLVWFSPVSAGNFSRAEM